MNSIKCRQRVADRGEILTPPGRVEAMLDLVKSEAERIDVRFLEPAGRRNFLVQSLPSKPFARRTCLSSPDRMEQ